MHDLDVLNKLNKTSRDPNAPTQRADEPLQDFIVRFKEYVTKKHAVKEDAKQLIQFDEKNPVKTLSLLAKISELKAQEFLSELPLTDYVAISMAMQSKDIQKIRAIVGKHKLKEQQYHEAIDTKIAGELKKISMASPHQSTIAPTKAATDTETPATPDQQSPANVTQNMVGAATTIKPSSGIKNVNAVPKPGGPVTPAISAQNIMNADSKTNTIAVQNPQTKKIEIKSVKDPKVAPELTDLIKQLGL
jgi:hypothetical protein